uniref:TraB domain-containing protein n=1 Tax=Aegilops tauschii subsp. strangulata TaxID=200361 RepID=A0A452ZGB1_AEGTS
MIRPPRLLLHRAPFLLRTPQPPRAPPLPARRALTPTLRSFASRRPAPLCLLMDPATPFSDARADAYAEFNGETGVDDPEFADAEAEAGGEDAGFDGPRELPEELARGVVCLECVTSAEAVAAGEGETCRVYVVGTAHVSQVSLPCSPATDFEGELQDPCTFPSGPSTLWALYWVHTPLREYISSIFGLILLLKRRKFCRSKI